MILSAIIIGKELPNPKAWLAFVNQANDTSILSRFAIAQQRIYLRQLRPIVDSDHLRSVGHFVGYHFQSLLA